MSVPDADTLIRLAEILEVSVSELLGTKIENENVASDVAEQLSRINEQLAIKNRRSRRIWKIVAIILAVIVLVNIFIAVFFSVPDLNSNTQNNPLAISDETISINGIVLFAVETGKRPCHLRIELIFVFLADASQVHRDASADTSSLHNPEATPAYPSSPELQFSFWRTV